MSTSSSSWGRSSKLMNSGCWWRHKSSENRRILPLKSMKPHLWKTKHSKRVSWFSTTLLNRSKKSSLTTSSKNWWPTLFKSLTRELPTRRWHSFLTSSARPLVLISVQRWQRESVTSNCTPSSRSWNSVSVRASPRSRSSFTLLSMLTSSVSSFRP